MFDGIKGQANIFTNYLSYVEVSEPPIIYHRWSYLTSLGAIIGRKAYIDLGLVGKIYPNLYVMCLGEPATKKSTAIKMIKRLLAAAGYDTFAADKTTKEKFLLDLEGLEENENGDRKVKTKYDLATAENLWGEEDNGGIPKEVFIVADEFNEFSGSGNLDFYTTLGNLWDYDNPEIPFTQRLKNTRSVSIYQPTISLLAGNTPELFARAFPPEAIGSGFLSRLLLIHGERSSRRITFPPPADKVLGDSLIAYLKKLSTMNPGKLDISPGAREILHGIYQEDKPVIDIRFKAYANRSFTQLLKICVILASAKFQTTVEIEDVIQANTILTHAEILMPKAMGEFGKSKNSDVTNKIMDYVELATKPVTTKEIWAQVYKDLHQQKDLMELLNGLIAADKLQLVQGNMGNGFLPKKTPKVEPTNVDWSFLTSEERDML